MSKSSEISRRDFLRGAMLLGASATAAPLLGNSLLAEQAHAVKLTTTTLTPTLRYQAHVADKGWLSYVSSAGIAGTTGQNRRMEAFRITCNVNGSSAISYRAHVADRGWMNWVNSSGIAGTVGQAKRLEAVQIKLTGAAASTYDVYYRMHVCNRGWLGWAKNGASAGSTGVALNAEALQIKLFKKGTSLNTGGPALLQKPLLLYRAHSADIGWMPYAIEGATAGTTGRAKRLEALTLSLKDFDGQDAIRISAHVSNIGWMSEVGSGRTSGTTGRGLGMEAVKIRLLPSLSPFFDIYYRVHVSNVGWLGWAKNGAVAGSTGQNLPIEAIQIQLLNKVQSASFATGGSATYVKPAVASMEARVQGRLDQILNGSLRLNSSTVMTLGSRFTGTRAGEQCKGYAKNMFYLCFGIVPGSTQGKPYNYLLSGTSGMTRVGYYSSMTAARAQSLYSKARPGDFVQIRRRHTGSHSAIVYSVQSGSITLAEANLDGNNTVYKRTYTWAQLANKNAGMSLYTATNYALR